MCLLFVAYLVLPSYPYGRSHCCLKQIGLALHLYASAHEGIFPAGESSPEASLSLLHRGYDGDANTLRGKTVPLATVEKILDRGELLGPDTCGWHYVEGLTAADDPQIAVVWDKVGLGHNGETLRGGGHSVLFVDGSERILSQAEWPVFLAVQERLLAQRKRR